MICVLCSVQKHANLMCHTLKVIDLDLHRQRSSRCLCETAAPLQGLEAASLQPWLYVKIFKFRRESVWIQKFAAMVLHELQAAAAAAWFRVVVAYQATEPVVIWTGLAGLLAAAAIFVATRPTIPRITVDLEPGKASMSALKCSEHKSHVFLLTVCIWLKNQQLRPLMMDLLAPLTLRCC
jgi:hypothetical protein